VVVCDEGKRLIWVIVLYEIEKAGKGKGTRRKHKNNRSDRPGRQWRIKAERIQNLKKVQRNPPSHNPKSVHPPPKKPKPT